MNHDDGLPWEVNAGICFCNDRIIPRGDLTEKYPSEHFRSELDLLLDTGNIVGGDYSSEHRRNVKDLYLGLPELLVGHWTIAGAELDGLGKHLSDAAAAADRLVIDLNIAVLLVILAEPLGVHGIRKCSACGVDVGLRRGERGEDRDAKH